MRPPTRNGEKLETVHLGRHNQRTVFPLQGLCQPIGAVLQVTGFARHFNRGRALSRFSQCERHSAFRQMPQRFSRLLIKGFWGVAAGKLFRVEADNSAKAGVSARSWTAFLILEPRRGRFCVFQQPARSLCTRRVPRKLAFLSYASACAVLTRLSEGLATTALDSCAVWLVLLTYC